MAARVAIYTGFGDDPGTAVPFSIRRGSGGRHPDWEGGDPRQTVKRYGDTVRVRVMGHNPWEVTFRLHLPTPAALAALLAARGTVATLRYPWGVTQPVGGTFARLGDGYDYLVIPGVRLMAVTGVEVQPDGSAEADAAFLRPYAEAG